MEKDDILYQSIIADPEQVSPDLDVSGIRTETETSPQLLAAVSEYPGLKFDPTQYSSYADLYDLYSTGLPMIDTSTVTTPAITTPVVETGGGGGNEGDESQGTGDLQLDTIFQDAGAVDMPGTIGNLGDLTKEKTVTIPNVNPLDEFDTPTTVTVPPLDLSGTSTDLIERGLIETPQEFYARTYNTLPSDYELLDNEEQLLVDQQYADAYSLAPVSESTGILDNAISGVSTAAKNAFENVKSGASTAAQFIADYGYPTYQALQGNLLAAGAAIVNPISLGAGFAGKIFESLGNTPSAQEYNSYSDEQKSEIDKAYGPGGVMQGYNVVSQFGQGVSGTVQDRIDKLEEVVANPNRDTSNVYTIDKDGNRIFNPSFNSAEKQLSKLYELQDKAGLTVDTTSDDSDSGDDFPTPPPAYDDFPTPPPAYDDFPTPPPAYDDFPTPPPAYDDFPTTSTYDDFSTTPAYDDFPTPPAYEDFTPTSITSVPAYEDFPTPAYDDFPTDDSTPTSTTSAPAYDDFPAPAPAYDFDDSAGGGGGGNGEGKIVCTMMNETYGFGSFRNKIWLRQSKDLAPEYQKGYHILFLPLVKIAKTNKIVRKILEHIATHRTIDIRQEFRGKTHMLGRVYRKVLEPICYLVGKYAKR